MTTYRVAPVTLDMLKQGIVHADERARQHRDERDRREEDLCSLRDQVALAENLVEIEKAKISECEIRITHLRRELDVLEKDIAEGRAILC